jgi:putative flippase GtrA
VATALQYAVLLLTVQWLHWDPVLGSSLGYLISAGLNYLLNYHFTFRSARAHLAAIPRFALITGAGFLLNGLMMLLLVRTLQVPYLAAQLVATAAVLGWNFLGSALWTFAEPGGRR